MRKDLVQLFEAQWYLNWTISPGSTVNNCVFQTVIGVGVLLFITIQRMPKLTPVNPVYEEGCLELDITLE